MNQYVLDRRDYGVYFSVAAESESQALDYIKKHLKGAREKGPLGSDESKLMVATSDNLPSSWEWKVYGQGQVREHEYA